eukprot:scaffold511612_cov18-Prasinocladus_malaysianus.AAC.1
MPSADFSSRRDRERRYAESPLESTGTLCSPCQDTFDVACDRVASLQPISPDQANAAKVLS